ncbi:hypothetical protein OEZ86_003634 [Tetradesmus obliquus]|nr:hypothetical protein OEZ86_003634 [Tetradesmus obliquus]
MQETDKRVHAPRIAAAMALLQQASEPALARLTAAAAPIGHACQAPVVASLAGHGAPLAGLKPSAGAFSPGPDSHAAQPHLQGMEAARH